MREVDLRELIVGGACTGLVGWRDGSKIQVEIGILREIF
jgi:hypothetical protein